MPRKKSGEHLRNLDVLPLKHILEAPSKAQPEGFYAQGNRVLFRSSYMQGDQEEVLCVTADFRTNLEMTGEIKTANLIAVVIAEALNHARGALIK